jgi:hypothetical protein
MQQYKHKDLYILVCSGHNVSHRILSLLVGKLVTMAWCEAGRHFILTILP